MYEEVGTIETKYGPFIFRIKNGGLYCSLPGNQPLSIENYLEFRDDGVFFPVKALKMYDPGAPDIQVPEDVLEKRERAIKEYSFRCQNEYLGTTYMSITVEFFLNPERILIVRHEEEVVVCKRIIEINCLKIVKAFGETIVIPSSILEILDRAEKERAASNAFLVYAGHCPYTGLDYFRLVPESELERVKGLFKNFGGSNTEGRFNRLRGWLTSEPEAVEAALGVVRSTISDRYAEIIDERMRAKRNSIYTMEKLGQLDEAFEAAECPKPEVSGRYQAGFEKIPLEGEKVQHPFVFDEAWIIENEYIWHIQENNSKYSTLTENNVSTGKAGPGAIGRRIPYNDNTARLILSFNGV